MKKMILSAIALMVAVSAPAFAEVQNIKVGGDITTTGVVNRNMTLNENANSDDDSFFTQTRVYVEADLTDNVQAYIRVINQRDWDADQGASIGNSSDDDIDLDLAYVKLSEFLYSPLTVTVGRQEIFWGSGLVVSDGVPNPNASTSLDQAWYGIESGFDAVRAQLDFDPITVDMFFANIDEDTAIANQLERDEYFYGLNVGYVLPNEMLLEVNYTVEDDSGAGAAVNGAGAAVNSKVRENIHTLAGRIEGSLPAVDENLSFEAELAYQWGDDIVTANNKEIVIDRDAWAAIVGATYAFDNDYKPTVSLTYDYRSGTSNTSATENGAWVATYYSRGVGNLIDQISNDGATTNNTYGEGGSSNIHAVTAAGTFVPFEDVEVGLALVYASFDEEINAGRGTDLGVEFIGSVDYDYTEDVSFGFKGSFFDPDDGFTAAQDDEAYELVGSVSVEF